MVDARPRDGSHALRSTAAVDVRSTLHKSPCFMTAVAPDTQLPSDRKRRRGAIEEGQSTVAAPSPEPPWKRAKRPFQSRQEAVAAYWNSLSALCLTRRALKEFDRRNKSVTRLATTASAGLSELSRDSTGPGISSDSIKRFARHGGPDLRDLRGCSKSAAANSVLHAMPSSQSTNETRSKSTNTLGESTVKTSHRRSSAYHRDFEQHLIDHDIHPNNRRQKPHNWDEIQQRIAQPRPSLSPSKFSDAAFETFQQASEEALTEAMMMRKAFPIISGNADIPSTGELPFGNLEPLTDGTLVDAKPDFFDGARPAQIHRRIRSELSSYITPSTQQQAPVLPNFFAEGKGPHGDASVAKRQACYDGVLGARGVHKLRAFGVEASGVEYPETLFDDNAYTITSTYHGGTGTLQMYTTHPTRSPDDEISPAYHMTQLRSLAMTDSVERFREGASAFRNARDWAKEQRDDLIAGVNTRVIGMPSETSTLESSGHSMLSQSVNEFTLQDSETSADALGLDASVDTNTSHKRSRGSEKGHTESKSKKRSIKRSVRVDRSSGRCERCSQAG